MKQIKIYDYTEYVSGKGNNGGCYGFWTTYTELKNGNFEISYGTTADLEYCPCCGRFGNCDCTVDDYEQISKEEMKKIISSFKETDDEWIEEQDIENSYYSEMMTVLRHAARYNSPEVAKLVLANPRFTNINARDKDSMTVLRSAVYNNSPEVAKLILADPRFTEINPRNHYGKTVLHYAARYSTEVAKLILADPRFIEINARDHYGETALHYAACYKSPEVAKLILTDPRFIEINARNHYGETALNYAISKGQVDIIKLISNDPRCDVYTALCHAEKTGNPETISIIKEAINNRDIKVKTKPDISR